MADLTKIYRLIWDDDKKLFMDPYSEHSEHSSKSITQTTSSNYYESDNIEDATNKINELGLVYESGDSE